MESHNNSLTSSGFLQRVGALEFYRIGVFNFANFTNFELFAKFISAKIFTATARYV